MIDKSFRENNSNLRRSTTVRSHAVNEECWRGSIDSCACSRRLSCDLHRDSSSLSCHHSVLPHHCSNVRLELRLTSVYSSQERFLSNGLFFASNHEHVQAQNMRSISFSKKKADKRLYIVSGMCLISFHLICCTYKICWYSWAFKS